LDAGGSVWISKTDQIATLRLVADAWDEREFLRAALKLVGYSTLTGSLRAEAVRLAEVEKNLTKWLSLLGLTPSDRSRLGVAEVKAASTLEKLRDRRARRAGLRDT
jgi:phage terminase small subunit